MSDTNAIADLTRLFCFVISYCLAIVRLKQEGSFFLMRSSRNASEALCLTIEHNAANLLAFGPLYRHRAAKRAKSGNNTQVAKSCNNVWCIFVYIFQLNLFVKL